MFVSEDASFQVLITATSVGNSLLKVVCGGLVKSGLEFDGTIQPFFTLQIWIVARMSESLIDAEVTTCGREICFRGSHCTFSGSDYLTHRCK